MSEAQAAAGWYPVEEGKLRYWDGSAWTDHFADGSNVEAPKGNPSLGRIQGAMSAAARRLTTDDFEVPEGTIWSAVGKSVGGIITGRYRLDMHYLYAAKGALRTDAQQVPIAGVVDVDVRQSVTQKARGVYSVLVHVDQGGYRDSIRMDDIPDGASAQRIINQTARDAKLMLQHRSIQLDGLRHQVTSTTRQEIAYEGLSGAGTVPTQGVPFLQVATGGGSTREPLPELEARVVEESVAVDPIAQLRELGSLRDSGILTEDEFAAKKTEILKRL